MIDWKKFAAEHGQYMAAWESEKLYIAGPTEFGCHYALIVDMPEKMDIHRNVRKIKPIADLIVFARRSTGFLPLSSIIGDAIEGYEQKRVECDCVKGECFECCNDNIVDYTDKQGDIHTITCPVCNGFDKIGKGPVPGCEDCDGVGHWMEYPKVSHTFNGRHFAKAVLRVLSLLPGVQVALGSDAISDNYFIFDGGEGVFMGMARPYEVKP